MKLPLSRSSCDESSGLASTRSRAQHPTSRGPFSGTRGDGHSGRVTSNSCACVGALDRRERSRVMQKPTRAGNTSYSEFIGSHSASGLFAQSSGSGLSFFGKVYLLRNGLIVLRSAGSASPGSPVRFDPGSSRLERVKDRSSSAGAGQSRDACGRSPRRAFRCADHCGARANAGHPDSSPSRHCGSGRRSRATGLLEPRR